MECFHLQLIQKTAQLNNVKFENMIIPFIALLAVIIVVAVFIMKNSKHEDKGNRPG
jgi:hypothetical protein